MAYSWLNPAERAKEAISLISSAPSAAKLVAPTTAFTGLRQADSLTGFAATGAYSVLPGPTAGKVDMLQQGWNYNTTSPEPPVAASAPSVAGVGAIVSGASSGYQDALKRAYDEKRVNVRRAGANEADSLRTQAMERLAGRGISEDSGLYQKQLQKAELAAAHDTAAGVSALDTAENTLANSQGFQMELSKMNNLNAKEIAWLNGLVASIDTNDPNFPNLLNAAFNTPVGGAKPSDFTSTNAAGVSPEAMGVSYDAASDTYKTYTRDGGWSESKPYSELSPFPNQDAWAKIYYLKQMK